MHVKLQISNPTKISAQPLKNFSGEYTISLPARRENAIV